MTGLAIRLNLLFSFWVPPAFAQWPPQAPAAATNAAPQGNNAPQGNVESGKALYLRSGCWTCHGYVAQGGDLNPNATGPRLEGRTPPWAAFQKYIRRPTGQMPPYTEK